MWTDEAMLGVMQKVMNSSVYIYLYIHAADEYSVPRTTLKDRIAGQVVQDTGMLGQKALPRFRRRTGAGLFPCYMLQWR